LAEAAARSDIFFLGAVYKCPYLLIYIFVEAAHNTTSGLSRLSDQGVWSQC